MARASSLVSNEPSKTELRLPQPWLLLLRHPGDLGRNEILMTFLSSPISPFGVIDKSLNTHSFEDVLFFKKNLLLSCHLISPNNHPRHLIIVNTVLLLSYVLIDSIKKKTELSKLHIHHPQKKKLHIHHGYKQQNVHGIGCTLDGLLSRASGCSPTGNRAVLAVTCPTPR